MLRIPQKVREEIFQHAAAHYPEECCGILLGKGGVVEMAVAAKNTAQERHHRYLIDPLDILHADNAGQAKGLEIVGFYHSHPDHPAAPSRTDLSLAWPDYVYVIASVTSAGAGELRGWRMAAPDRLLDEVPLR